MPAGRHDLGERLRVFTRSAGLRVTPGCVIEGHGEQLFMGNTLDRGFAVPLNKTVYFYTPHGAPQRYITYARTYAGAPHQNHVFTDALEHIANGAAVAIDTYVPGSMCPNYNVTKIQKSAGGCFDGAWSNYWGDRNTVAYEDIVRFLDVTPTALDIVTIRNRRFRSDMTLLDVIEELGRHAYNYMQFHCSFCRNAAWYQGNAPVGVRP